MPARLYVLGRVWLETDGALLSERDLAGRQARLLLVALAVERAHPVPRETLADRLWDGAPPGTWEASLDVLVSRVRSWLAAGGGGVRTGGRCHQLELPPGSRVDLETAVRSLDAAEGALRRGDLGAAWAGGAVAVSILQRPLLAGDDSAWVHDLRRTVEQRLVRALSCLSSVHAARGDHVLAADLAARTVELEPFRETGHRQLMAAHAARGDRAEALRAYERCRRLLAEELGTPPSRETQALAARIEADG